jgi:hypothetical protein
LPVHVLIYPAAVIARRRAARSGNRVGGFPPLLVRRGVADAAI